MNRADVLVLGGGAAGLMCAITAAQRGRRVIVLEGSNRVGKKILMSGGGRCNFTNLHCEPSRFLSHNPHFCKSALSRYTQHDFIALVEKHGIPYHEKTLGQLFCDNSSKDIVAMLLSECDDAGVIIETSVEIGEVRKDDTFTVKTNCGDYSSDALVVATGGLSIPKMGASGFGYELARQFGLYVHDTHAGLVPFTFSGAMHDMTTRLSGVSTWASLTAGGAEFTENILFTHRGLSGPAALQVSSYWKPGEDLLIDLQPGKDAGERLLVAAKVEQPRALLRNVLSTDLPRRLVGELQALWWPQHTDTPLAELRNEFLADIGRKLNAWTVRPAATEGYRTAEVTLGGVDTNELSSQTMAAKKVPGLYFIGEVVDVTGHLGGFNFQWAWASGYAAGNAV
jgi:predicted Rossmann fold flavoprotein